MIFPKLVSLVFLPALLLTSGSAVAQYQILEIPADDVGAASDFSPGAEFSWSVRVVDGETILAGDVPYASVRKVLSGRAGEDVIDRMGVAQGAPRGFLGDAIRAVEASALLADGAVTYEDGIWRVTGTVRQVADTNAIEDILGASTGNGSAWQIELQQLGSDDDSPPMEGAEAAELTPDEEIETPADDIEQETGGEDETVVATDVADAAEVTTSGEMEEGVAPAGEATEMAGDEGGLTATDAAQVASENAESVADESLAPVEEPAATSVESDAARRASDIAGSLADEETEGDDAREPEAEDSGAEALADAETSQNAPDIAQTLGRGDAVDDDVPAEGAAETAAGEDEVLVDAEYEVDPAEPAPGGGAEEGDFAPVPGAESNTAAPEVDANQETLDDAAAIVSGEAARAAPGSEAAEMAEDDAEALSVAEICRDRIDAFMADRSILFASGSARLAPESEADLADLAQILADCPAAPVFVEGHTDADGRADSNLILSLSRAEAVVYALTQLGVDPGRLYAVGYGASLPIASNETAAGKAQNRRIVFSFEDAAGSEEGVGH